MSAQAYEPLRAVLPLDDQKIRWAWLLQVRFAAQRALDAARSVPAKAASYIGRLVNGVHLDGALGWLRTAAARLARPALRLLGRLGTIGVGASVAAVVTSAAGQAVIGKVGGWLGTGLGWLAQTTYSAVDKVLRLFGKAGNKAADALFGVVVSVGGKLASVAVPVVHRVARLSDPKSAHIRLFSGLAGGFALHRVLKAVIANSYLRMLVEGVVLPFLADSRVGRWIRRQVTTLRERAVQLREQAQTLPGAGAAGRNHFGGATGPGTAQDAPRSEGEGLPLPPWRELDVDEPVPANRAERRAQQRQQQRRRG